MFIASLLAFIDLSFPYTISLISIQWLQKISHYQALFWVRKLILLFDAYTGPYKYKHRYWTGLLLLMRAIFLLIFSLNRSNNPAVNLLAIAVVSICLQLYLSYMKVYKNWLHNILEMTSFLNLCLLSVATYYQLSTNGNRIVTTTVSTSISFITFVLVTLHHLIQRLLSLRRLKKFNIGRQLYAFCISRVNHSIEQGQEEAVMGQNKRCHYVTHTSVELYEPLVD